MNTTTAAIVVLAIHPIANAGKLLALAEVELVIDGVSLLIHGVQVRADGEKTEVSLPRYRAPDGTWKTSITLPAEVRDPMGDVVMEAGIEAGILKKRNL
jgi:stage V sporulation protein G